MSITDEVPFDIPDSWVWIHHNSFFEVSGGSQPPKDKFISSPKDGYVRLYQIRDYGKSPVPVYIPAADATKTTKKGDILLARYGASLGKVFFAEDGAYNVAMAKVIPLFSGEWVLKEYLYLFYQSKIYQDVIFGNSRSAQAGFNKEDLDALWIPVPPIEEQKRIVDKYKEILPIIEKYDQTEASFEALNGSFPNELKKSILQMAVQGRLVSQDPHDEPANELLKRIHAEKERLIKAGIIKRDKSESVIFRRDNSHYEKRDGVDHCIDDELPFDIPESWRWIHLNNIAISELGKTMDKAKNTGSAKRYLCSINVYWDGIKLDQVKTALFESGELEKYRLNKGDLLICEGGDAGRSAIWESDDEMYYQNALHRVRFFCDVDPYYFLLVLELYKMDGTITEHAKGMTIKHLVQGSLNELYFPLPPINEQHRIVEKYRIIANQARPLAL